MFLSAIALISSRSDQIVFLMRLEYWWRDGISTPDTIWLNCTRAGDPGDLEADALETFDDGDVSPRSFCWKEAALRSAILPILSNDTVLSLRSSEENCCAMLALECIPLK